MKSVLVLIVASALMGSAAAAPQAKVENCGWLIKKGDALVQQPDAKLKPSDPEPLPVPPSDARAAYCVRDTIMTYVGDERLLADGFPLVIRSGEREGVLEVGGTAEFDYHREGDQYVPGRPPQ